MIEPSIFDSITADEVKRIRAESGCGMMEIKEKLQRRVITDTIKQMRWVEESLDPRLAEILLYLTNRGVHPLDL